MDRALVLTRVYASCTRSGTYRIYLDGDKIGGGRVDANRTESLFEFDPSRRIEEGEVLKIEFEALSPAPAAILESHAMGFLIDTSV